MIVIERAADGGWPLKIWSVIYMIDENNIEKKILSAQETMDLVKETTFRMLDALEFTESKHTTMEDLKDKVVAQTGVKPSTVGGLIPLLTREWARDGKGTVALGRLGGVSWGKKEPRIDPRKRCETCNQVIRQK